MSEQIVTLFDGSVCWYCDKTLVNFALSAKSVKLPRNVLQYTWSNPEMGTNYDCIMFSGGKLE